MPQDWNYGTDHMGIASRALGRLREGLECYGLWVLKKCANRNVLGSYYVPAEFLFW
jgi:hypothetical protein